MGSINVCPSCQSSSTRRSHSRGPEWIARYLLAHKMYRCRDCGHRWGAISFNLREDRVTAFLWAGIIVAIALLIFFK